VFDHLQIPYRQERWLVGLADMMLRMGTLVGASLRSPLPATALAPPQRILLLRLERVGDLLMVLDAIAHVRAFAPRAQIDLVVGSWNAPLARLIRNVDAVETLDVPWMAREGRGESWTALLQRTAAWRGNRYDLAINFEPDIRSNLMLALSGARLRAGFASGGGAAVLTHALQPDPAAHIAANASALVTRAFSRDGRAADATDSGTWNPPDPKLAIPEEARRRARALIGPLSQGGAAIGIQPASGRQIKEWDPSKFAEVGAALARSRDATIILIGSTADRPALDAVRSAWPRNIPLVELPPETDLVVLAAVLEQLALFITGDTGPMHLAASVGTPVLAIFGPSLPTRYAPLSRRSRIVRIDIPCSPCNLMRRPPSRCVGHVPDCLSGIGSAEVIEVANDMLNG
jgi:ADP-heptose:LPS heptosyltransferase